MANFSFVSLFFNINNSETRFLFKKKNFSFEKFNLLMEKSSRAGMNKNLCAIWEKDQEANPLLNLVAHANSSTHIFLKKNNIAFVIGNGSCTYFWTDQRLGIFL